MQNIYEVLFSQYADYTPLQIWLEFIAVVLGIISVVYSKNNSIMLYPTGLASTLIYMTGSYMAI
jgi:nicotinamide mononucleotide transporter